MDTALRRSLRQFVNEVVPRHRVRDEAVECFDQRRRELHSRFSSPRQAREALPFRLLQQLAHLSAGDAEAGADIRI